MPNASMIASRGPDILAIVISLVMEMISYLTRFADKSFDQILPAIAAFLPPPRP
jgi:hypothetical protein